MTDNLDLPTTTGERALHECERLIYAGAKAAAKAGGALCLVRDQRLYQVAGYKNFDIYCRKRLRYTRRQVDRIIAGYQVAIGMRPPEELPPETKPEPPPVETEVESAEPDEPAADPEVEPEVEADEPIEPEVLEAETAAEVAARVDALDEAEIEPTEAIREIHGALYYRPTDIHGASKSVEHYTPDEILVANHDFFGGPVGLDPFSDAGGNVAAMARYTREDDSLALDSWVVPADHRGRRSVYANWPYGPKVSLLAVEKLIDQYVRDCFEEAVLLGPARIGCRWWNLLTRDRKAPWIGIDGRLTFKGNTDPAQFPSVLLYLGADPDRFFGVYERQHKLGHGFVRPPLSVLAR